MHFSPHGDEPPPADKAGESGGGKAEDKGEGAAAAAAKAGAETAFARAAKAAKARSGAGTVGVRRSVAGPINASAVGVEPALSLVGIAWSDPGDARRFMALANARIVAHVNITTGLEAGGSTREAASAVSAAVPPSGNDVGTHPDA